MEKSLFLKWWRYNCLFKPLACLPFPWAYHGAGMLARYDRRYNRNAGIAIKMGLEKAFPDRTADPAVLEDWLSRYFGMMARETMDVFCMSRVTRLNGSQLVRLQAGSLDVLHAAKRDGRGIILVTAHFSRLNMLALSLALAGETLGMLTMVVDERNADLDSVDRTYLNKKIMTLLAFIGGRWVTLGDNLRGLYEGLRGGETIIILFDAYIPEKDQNKLRTPFLGGVLEISRGIERLAEKTGARLVYGVAKERGWGIEAELRALPDEPHAGLRAAVAQLEKDVTETPWQWWQWSILDYIWSPPSEERST
jgi:lauroyl/myristoyl acyltransferase